MRTFTVTYHHGTNYGALLQAYALQQTIQNLGHRNTIFEYAQTDDFYLPISFSKPSYALKCMYFNLLRFIRRKKLRRLKKSFADFHNKHLNLSQVYHSMEELRNVPPEVDAYIAGSDQIWRFLNPDFIPARFLDFGDKNTLRISYAASLEKLNYTDEQKILVNDYLSRFSGISLREESSAKYISEIIGKPTERVIDPVFLLTAEDWEKVTCEPRIDGPFIVCYQVQSNSRMQEVVDQLKQRTGYKTVSINNSEINWIKTDYAFYDVSPEEFLGFYKKASVIITASFHGSALGILFGKPTYGLIKESGKNRIYEIFDLFHLNEYCISAESSIPDHNISTERLQYVQLIAEAERNNGLGFLGRNLKNND